jgi:hypothetical protein
MNELRCDPRFQAGDIALEAEYYRVHYGTTLRNADQLDTVIRRLRSAFTPEGIVAARQIEDRLYDDTWVRDDYDLTPALSGSTSPRWSSTATMTSSRSRWSIASRRPSPGRS